MRKSREHNEYNIERSIKVQGANVFNAMQFPINFIAENRVAYATFKTLRVKSRIYRDLRHALLHRATQTRVTRPSFSPNYSAHTAGYAIDKRACIPRDRNHNRAEFETGVNGGYFRSELNAREWLLLRIDLFHIAYRFSCLPGNSRRDGRSHFSL